MFDLLFSAQVVSVSLVAAVTCAIILFDRMLRICQLLHEFSGCMFSLVQDAVAWSFSVKLICTYAYEMNA